MLGWYYGMRDLNKQANSFEQTLLNAASAFDVLIAKYSEVIQRQQFLINELVTLEDVNDGKLAKIDLHNRVNQQILVTSALIVVPTGTTSLTVTIGRYSAIFDNPAQPLQLFPLQYVIGSGDNLNIVWTPAGNHPAYFAVFGKLTGGNFQL